MNIGLAIQKTIRTLLLTLCEFVYSMIVFFFNIFEAIGTAEIVKDTYIMDVYERVGLILGLFMIFRITFSTIQYVINPDLLSDKKTGFGNVIKKAFLVVVLLGTTPYIFDAAFEIQNMVIEKNVLPKLIVGATGDVDDFGINLAEFTFFNFYKVNENATSDVCTETDYNVIRTVFHNTGDLSATKNCIEKYDETNKEWAIDFDYHGLLPLIVGVLILWIIIMYTIQVAVRAFQLAYLQLIAPIPIMLYLDPKKDDQLMKWGKQCLTTYLDLFIRVGIIYFVVFLIEMITAKDFLNGIYVSGGFFPNFYVQLILVIALLIFAKKVPDLFKELFPMSGGAAKFDFGMKAPKEAKQVFGTLAGAATGAAVGLIGGPGVGGRIKGVFGGLTKGAISGAKGKKVSEVASARAAQNVRNRQLRDSDSTFGGRLDASLRNTFGLESGTSAIDRQIESLDDQISKIDDNEVFKQNKKNNTVIGAYKAMKDEAEKELLKNNDMLKRLNLRAQHLGQHIGEYDAGLKRKITTSDVITAQKTYQSQLDSDVSSWINTNLNNEVVAKNMQIITNTVGTTVNNSSAAKSASDAAKRDNVSIATTIVNLENDKDKLNKQKSDLNKQKKQVQVNENFANKKK